MRIPSAPVSKTIIATFVPKIPLFGKEGIGEIL